MKPYNISITCRQALKTVAAAALAGGLSRVATAQTPAKLQLAKAENGCLRLGITRLERDIACKITRSREHSPGKTIEEDSSTWKVR